ncbi:MAG: enoyl-CoA hydratase/isomerase family protein [Myxococcales bacterium]|nr:enoyl-CoA hydratase/isomerase family protein [Myxococcales bacterium]
MHEVVLQSPNLNAMSTATMSALREELRRAGGAPLLLRGEGRAFSAGLDLQEVLSLEGQAQIDFLTLLEELVLDLFTYPGPTVAWVNGHAIAGGCILALACDHRVATHHPQVKIGLSEVAIGVAFPPAPLAVVRSRIPAPHVDEAVLSARLYSPSEALARGIVDALADDEGARARAALDTLAALPAEAYAQAKASLRGEVAAAARAARPAFLAGGLRFWSDPALRQRIAARLGKRSS